MHASEPEARGFLGVMAAAAALPLAAAAALNLAMDPYSAALDQWYRLRGPLHDDVADRAPDAGTAARMNAVARSRAPILILGTSRVQVGLETDPSQAFNAGQASASFEDNLRVAEAAAGRPFPPRYYLIEASSQLETPRARAGAADPGWLGLEDRLVASEASHVSIHLLAHHLGIGAPRDLHEDFFLTIPPRPRPPRPPRLPDSEIGAAFNTVGTPPAAYLRNALDRLLRLCAGARATVVVAELPTHPDLLTDPRITRNIRQRAAAYRAMAAAAARHARCRFRFLDYSGLTPETRVGAASDRGQWLNSGHFAPSVGEAILKRAVADQRSAADTAGR
ncbi:MAG TPA: hypothetical protein VF535_02935 [Allosphingosinicella sp.]|jgi:hypothetical protein